MAVRSKVDADVIIVAVAGFSLPMEAWVDMDDTLAVTAPAFVCSATAFLFICFLNRKISSYATGKDIGVPAIDFLAGQIRAGSVAFLLTEYSYLSLFVAALASTLFALFYCTAAEDPLLTATAVSASFVTGATLSATAGYWGMMVATDGNAKTTAACAGNKALGRKGTLNDGLTVAFTTGAVMGFAVVGLGLAGVSGCYTVLSYLFTEPSKVMQCLAGFGFGASSIALFARVAGGIYTKAADVGADLVGKVEEGIDEDDPHNPAVIADNVGDNVGDVAGMGADLFESYVGSIIAAATLAVTQEDIGYAGVRLAFLLPAAGVLCSIVGYFAVSTDQEGKGWNVSLGALMWALEKGMFVAGGLFVVAAFVCVCLVCGLPLSVYCAVVLGMLAGIAIGKITEYYTSFDYGPVISIKDRGKTGPATVVIQGLGVGMISCVPPVVVLAATIMCVHPPHLPPSHTFSRLYGRQSRHPGAPMPSRATTASPSPRWACSRLSASPSLPTRMDRSPTTQAASRRWPTWGRRCATSPTRSTRWATPPPPQERASPSDRPSSPPSPSSPPLSSRSIRMAPASRTTSPTRSCFPGCSSGRCCHTSSRLSQ